MRPAERDLNAARTCASAHAVRLGLIPMLLALLALLLLASGARAAEATAGEPTAGGTSPAPQEEGATGGAEEPASQTPAPTPEPPAVVETPPVPAPELPAAAETPLPTPEVPAVTETPLPTPELPAVTETPSPTPELPASETPTPTPVVEAPAPPPVVEAPAPAPQPPVVLEVPAPAPGSTPPEPAPPKPESPTHTESIAEEQLGEHAPAHPGAPGEALIVERLSEPASKSTAAGPLAGTTPPTPPALGLFSPPIEPYTTAAEATGAAGRIADAAVTAKKSAAFGAGPVVCEPLQQANRAPCGGWLVARPPTGAMSSPVLSVPGGPLPPDSTDGGGASRGGRSSVTLPPGSPSPSPAPSGASGSAASGSGGGLGLSGFVTLAGLLLLAAPRATRRLRLLCRPWRATCFALIPERPG